MKYIKSISLSGFKSFSAKNPQRVQLVNDFNCIVGHNGSGKSNLYELLLDPTTISLTSFSNLHRLDAICLAMGCDTKSLRVSSNSDFLCTHGLNKESFACVKVVIGNESSKGGDEICVHLFNDKNTRSYTLNGRHTTIRALRSFLKSEGIRIFNSSLPSFIILQNTVVSLGSKSPKELFSMIADISGALSFSESASWTKHQIEKYRKDESIINTQILQLENLVQKQLQEAGVLEQQEEMRGEIERLKKVLKQKEYNEAFTGLQKCEVIIEDFPDKIKKISDQLQELQIQKEHVTIKLQHSTTSSEEIETKLIQAKKETRKSEWEYNSLLSECELENQIQRGEDLRRKLADRLNEIERDINSEEKEIEQLAEREVSLTSQISCLENQLRTIEVETVGTASLQQKFTSCIQRLELQEEIVKAKVTDFQKLSQERSILQERKLELSVRIEHKKEQMTALQAPSETEYDLEKKREELLHIRNELDLVLSNISHLQRFYSIPIDKSDKNILGPLVTLLQPTDPAITLPLSIISGQKLFSIIARSSSGLENVITKLKQQKRNFQIWPLDRIEAYTGVLDKIEAANSLDSFCKENLYSPLELLKFENTIKIAIERCFGSLGISKDNQAATYVQNRYGIPSVTIEGTLFKKGSVTGGWFANGTQNSLQRRYEEKALTEKSISLRKQLSSMEIEIRKIQDSILKGKQRCSLLDELSHMSSSVEEIDEAISIKQNSIESLKLSEHRIELESLRKEKETLAFLLSANSDRTTLVKEYQNQRQQCTEELGMVCSSIDQKKSSLLLLEDQKVQIQNKQLKMTKRENDGQQDLKEKEQNLIRMKKVLDSLSHDLRLNNQKSLEFQKDIESLNSSILELKRTMSKMHNEYAAAKKEKEIRKMDEKTIQNVVLSDLERNQTIEEIEVRKKMLEQHLKGLDMKYKSVDLNTIETRKAHLNELKKNASYLEQGIKQLEDDIERSQAFITKANEEAFEEVNRSFQMYFMRMVPSKRAMLVKVTDNIEDGIEFQVQNATGERGDTAQLSGGQKTLLSLSFMFALATYMKSPFYLMDEIDAALDEHNQILVAKIIREIFQNVQVITVSHNQFFQTNAKRTIHVQKEEASGSQITRVVTKS